MRVTENARAGTLSIEGLTPGQFAYIAGLVAESNALANDVGSLAGNPVVPDARKLYTQLHEAAVEYEVDQLMRAVERSQQRWRQRTARAETTDRKRVAA